MGLIYKYENGDKIKRVTKRLFDDTRPVLYGDLTPEILDNLKTKNGYIISEEEKNYQTKMPNKDREKKVLDVYFAMLDNGVSEYQAKQNLLLMGSSYGSWRGENVGKNAEWGFDHADIPEWLKPNSEFKKQSNLKNNK